MPSQRQVLCENQKRYVQKEIKKLDIMKYCMHNNWNIVQRPNQFTLVDNEFGIKYVNKKFWSSHQYPQRPLKGGNLSEWKWYHTKMSYKDQYMNMAMSFCIKKNSHIRTIFTEDQPTITLPYPH